jgi:hypothetical protein
MCRRAGPVLVLLAVASFVPPEPLRAAGKRVASLGACPAWGSEKPGSTRGVLNEVKRRRPDSGVPVPITFEDIKALQRQADGVVKSGRGAPVTAEDRARLRDLAAGGKRFSEGDLVALVGYVVGRAKANVGESANCYLLGSANNDFEFWVAGAATATPYEAIVAEMIPQDRPPTWTLAKLRGLAAAARQVQVIGQLMFDTQHVPNPGPGGAPGLPRASIWEVHPVTKFLVCRRSGACDPAGEADWQPLEAISAR